MSLNDALMFVEVVRGGGFTAAARRLNVPKSTVSARVRALEARLGTPLLKRSTRKLSLTDEGETYFAAVADAVDVLVRADAASSGSAGVLSGRIRFTAPFEFPRTELARAVGRFTGAWSN